jgi:N-acylneuraminate cytidylyltransferase
MESSEMLSQHSDGELPSSHRKRVLALITARGGSKGLPRKNVLEAGSRPLIAWTIEAAKNSVVVDRIVLSSDDDEIIDVAKAWGCEIPFRRPTELANDSASSIDVVLHALEIIPDYEYVVVLQPTSPLRTGADIDAAFALMQESNADSCVSVCETEQSPYWMYLIGENDQLASVLPHLNASRRQELPRTYVLNGAIYIARCDWLRQQHRFVGRGTVGYRMPVERSIDIDSAEDLEVFRQRVAE